MAVGQRCRVRGKASPNGEVEKGETGGAGVLVGVVLVCCALLVWTGGNGGTPAYANPPRDVKIRTKPARNERRRPELLRHGRVETLAKAPGKRGAMNRRKVRRTLRIATEPVCTVCIVAVLSGLAMLAAFTGPTVSLAVLAAVIFAACVGYQWL